MGALLLGKVYQARMAWHLVSKPGCRRFSHLRLASTLCWLGSRSILPARRYKYDFAVSLFSASSCSLLLTNCTNPTVPTLRSQIMSWVCAHLICSNRNVSPTFLQSMDMRQERIFNCDHVTLNREISALDWVEVPVDQATRNNDRRIKATYLSVMNQSIATRKFEERLLTASNIAYFANLQEYCEVDRISSKDCTRLIRVSCFSIDVLPVPLTLHASVPSIGSRR